MHGAAWLIAAVADEWPAAAADRSEETPADRFLLAQARLCAAQVLSRDGATADDWLAALDAALALSGRPPERYGETGLVGLLRWQDEKLLGVYGPWRADAREGTFLPLLRLSDAPRIVNVSSVAGSLAAVSSPTNAYPIAAGYGPSKTALTSLTLQYAKGLAPEGILVNAVCPGFVATDLNGFRGTRTPAQGATAAVRMATIPADGPTGTFTDEDGPLPW